MLLCGFALSCGGHKTRPQPPAAPDTVALPVSPVSLDETKKSTSSEILPSSDDNRPAAIAADLPPKSPAPVAGTAAGPDIRIGLDTSAKEIRVSAPDTFYVEVRSESSWRQVKGEVVIGIAQESQTAKPAQEVRKPQTNEKPKIVYQIQAAALSRPESAAELRDSLAVKLGVPVAVRLNPENGMSQIRIGEFSTREEAQKYLPTARLDYPDSFIVTGEIYPGAADETASGKNSGKTVATLISGGTGGRTVVTLSGANGLNLRNTDGFRIYPASASAFLRVNGKAYRGFFDIFPNKSGRLTLVNQLVIEDYLPGVVPAEMSPNTYPEFAALAAQAIAARTYALKNMGRYRSDGFDLTNDTRTQVYGGVEAERSVTNDIVLQTSGIAIYHDGKLIDAMFMSTCGGRTEDFGLVYGASSVPYLKSVICAVDYEGDDENEGITLTGAQDMTGTFRAADGSLANRNIELARVIGLIPLVASVMDDSLSIPLGADEARRLIDTASAITKSTRRLPPSVSGIATRGGFLRQAAEVFFGGDEIQRRISRSDENYYMANLTDRANVPDTLRQTIAYLMQRKLWRPTAENAVDAQAPMRRGDAIALLVDWIEAEKQDILRRGDFVDAGKRKADKNDDVLNIKSGGGGNSAREFKLARNLRLFRVDPGQVTPIREMNLIGAEKLLFHVNDKNEIDFLQIELSPSGAASDRLSYAATWKTTLTRTTVAEKLRDLAGDIGTFMDIQPSRLGFSGRAVQIRAIGSRKTTVMNGYKVRGALDLRDTLFTLTREYNADGAVTSFIFSGRGFGHGVGLCQTGAYGMAKAGRNYTEILKTYYTGVDVKKAY